MTWRDPQKDKVPSFDGRLSSLLAPLGKAFAWLFLRFFDFALYRRKKYYEKLTRYCTTACFVECWKVVCGNKPIDDASPVFDDIFKLIEFAARKASEERGEFNALEHILLYTRFSRWVLRDTDKPDDARAKQFASMHGLTPTIEKYVNLHNYVAYVAMKEIRPLEELAKKQLVDQRPSVDYWKGIVRFKELPAPLGETTKPRTAAKFLRANVIQLQSELAQSNFLKLDFSFSDISTLIALSGTLLLVLGYTRVFILGAYFRFPFQEYFGASDYLARSLNITGIILFSAALTTAFGFMHISSANTYSLSQEDLRRKSVTGKVHNVTWHFLGASSLPVAAFHYYMVGLIDPLLALVGMIYVGSFAVAHFSARYFDNPLKAYLFLSFIYLSFANTFSSVISEINSLNHPSETAAKRIAKFNDSEYQESDWQFIAFTSDYVVMRKRQDHQILIRARSDLKSIETNADRP